MTMKSVDLPHLRSVVLAGHTGAGKTTLAEQLLFRAGAVSRLGKVEDGTSHLDFEPEEQKRRESLSLAVATFEANRHIKSIVNPAQTLCPSFTPHNFVHFNTQHPPVDENRAPLQGPFRNPANPFTVDRIRINH